MALAATTVWEVRTAGSDTLCSGGYVAGGGGTDYSQQSAAQYNGTNLVIDGAVNTKVTSATHNFVAADVGNLLRITAGSGFTTGFFQIVSVAANAATLDRSAGTLGSTAGTFYVGGALATPGLAVANIVAGHTIYAAGSYTSTTDTANVAGGRLDFTVSGTQAAFVRFIGYTTSRGDGGKYTITHGATFTTELIKITTSVAFVEVRNFALVGNATSGTRAINLGGRSNRLINFKVSGYNAGGNNIVVLDNSGTIKHFEISGGATGASAALLMFGSLVNISDGWVHGNAGNGITISGSLQSFNRVISTDHTGANGRGFNLTSSTLEFSFFECVGWNNAAGDFLLTNSSTTLILTRCVSGGGGAYNFDNQSAVDAIQLWYCAAKANTTGLYPVTPNTSVSLATLTGDPFTNQAAGDFSPDNTASEGAALRGVAETLFSLTTTYADTGVAQHQDAGGGGGGTGPNVIVSSGAGSRGGSW